MAVSALWYGNAMVKAFNKEIDLDTDTVKVMLCTSSYTPDQDTHDYVDDVTNEVSATGYTAGGATLSNKAVNYTGETNVFKFDADDVAWTAAITARYAVVYVDTGTASTSPLLGYVDFGQDETSGSGQTFTIVWASSGILTLTVAAPS